MSKISSMPVLSSPTGKEIVPVVGEDGDNYQILVEMLRGYLGLEILGELEKETDLPEPSLHKQGDTFSIRGHFWTLTQGAWEELGDFKGQRGLSAFEEAVDNGSFDGTYQDWLDSLRGQDGIGLRVLGSFNSTDDLPLDDNLPGDTYIIKKEMWVWDTLKWAAVGQVGPNGYSAYEVAQRNGFVGTQQQWLNSLIGKDAYQLAVSVGFNGTLEQWLESLKVKGDKGDSIKGDPGPRGEPAHAIKILGEFATPDELPSDGTQQPGDAYYVVKNLWIWDAENWLDLGPLKGADGKDGKDAYEIAKEEGFEGTVQEWLISLKGNKGDKGDSIKGDPGPAGPSAFQLAVSQGFEGTLDDWLLSLEGPKGADGKPLPGINFKGSLPSEQDLPQTGNVDTDAYYVNLTLFVWLTDKWVNCGSVKGEPGSSAYELAVVEGFQGSVQQWLESLKGKKGDDGEPGLSAYQLAMAEGFEGTLTEWLASLVGPEGPLGAGLVPRGSVADLDALNAIVDPAVGDLYFIDATMYGWSGNGWVTLTTVKGKDGDKGDPGLNPYEYAVTQGFVGSPADWFLSLEGSDGQSAYELAKEQGYEGSLDEWLASLKVKGDPGPAGPMGPGVKILDSLNDVSELPETGIAGEGYLIGTDFWGWTDAAGYKNMGRVTGPEGPPGPSVKGDPGEKGEQGTIWIALPREPQPTDGRTKDYFVNTATLEFFMKTNNVKWSSLGFMGGGNVHDAPFDDKPKLRLNGEWVDQTVLEAPAEGYYVRSNGEWVQLDRYDLKVSVSTGECDVSKQQCFEIDMTANRTFTFVNLPPNRVMTIILVLVGTGGTMTWPAALRWSNNEKPVLATAYTNISILWDGKRLTGSVAQSV